MDYPVTGIHHITVCASGAQEDVDFLTQVVGQRLIKQTILFDGRYAHYHMYYANANAEPGSVYTTFPYKRVPGRKGSGQIEATGYSVPKGSISFWVEHLDRHNVPHGGKQERFGHPYIRFEHPSGLELEVVEEANDKRKPWTTEEIAKDAAIRGFFAPVLSVREVSEQERFYVDALGMKKTGVDGNAHRFEIGAGGPAKTVILLHEPEKAQGSWGFGAGTAHHMALEVASDEDLATQKGIYEELGYTDCSEIKDRNYFHSIYCRSPAGILTECAANAEGGFTRDEAYTELGQHLLLPPWFEARRQEIVAMLEPIRVPESNGPVTVQHTSVPVVSRRTDATFVGEDISQP